MSKRMGANVLLNEKVIPAINQDFRESNASPKVHGKSWTERAKTDVNLNKIFSQ